MLHINANLLIELLECTYTICVKCKSKNIVPIIYGLIERQGPDYKDFYPGEKFVGILEENGFIYNPGCVPDSDMKDNMIPHKKCTDCNEFFDFREF